MIQIEIHATSSPLRDGPGLKIRTSLRLPLCKAVNIL